MKKLPVCLPAMIFFFMSFAQQPASNDVILKVNGEELTGKVLKIGIRQEVLLLCHSRSGTYIYQTKGATRE